MASPASFSAALLVALQFSVLASPACGQWRQVEGNGSGAWRGGIAFDEQHGQLVRFGGGWFLSDQRETRVFDGVRWERRLVGGPTFDSFNVARVLMTWDSARERVLLCNDISGVPWEWDGSTWTQRAASAGPPAGRGGALAFDRARGRAVLVTYDSSGASTWEWDGSAWSQPATITPPVAAMAYASSRSRIVGIVSGSLYEWTGAAWVLLASGVLPTVGPIPLAPNEWAAAFDEWRQVLVATFMTAPGTLYEWNGTSVTTSTVTGGPTAREEAAMTFDPVRGMTVLAGGTAVNANGTGGLVGLADAWGWDGQQWRELSPTPPAAPVAMAYDLARLRLVASGAAIRGFGATGTWQVPGTWERDAIGWHRMATAFSPGPGRMVFDSVLGQVVMVEDNSNSIAPRSWNGTTWSPTVLVVCPPPRSQFALTFDTVQGQVVLFGGGNGSALFNDTWVWNRQAWAQAQPASNPSPRAQTALAFDQTRGRAVLFGGRTAVGAVDDTWEWDGLNQSWTQQPVAAPPPARVAHAMTWDPLHGGVTMTGGVLPMVIGGAPVNLRLPLELWSWNGSTWTNAPINQLRRSEPAMEFDFARGRLVVQGGYDADSLLGDPVSTSDTVELAAGSPNVGIGLPANCAAGPQPLLQAESLPFLGNALFALTLTGGSPNALAALGFGLPLPEAFAPVFGTGCRLLLSAPATVVFRPTNPGGAARWPLPVPASPALRGTLLFAQAAAIDGAGQVSTTRSLFVTISD